VVGSRGEKFVARLALIGGADDTLHVTMQMSTTMGRYHVDDDNIVVVVVVVVVVGVYYYYYLLY